MIANQFACCHEWVTRATYELPVRGVVALRTGRWPFAAQSCYESSCTWRVRLSSTAVPPANAMRVIQQRLKLVEQEQPPVEYKFTLGDNWSRKLFMALARGMASSPTATGGSGTPR